MNVLGNTALPSTAVDACVHDGFHLNSGVKIVGGSGCILVGGEAFSWRPWISRNGKLLNAKGQWDAPKEAFGVLDLLWPKPGINQSLSS
jgi:hypothetical protein